MSENQVYYQDKDVIIKGDRVIIKCYFFPFGNSKTIKFSEIQRVQMKNYVWKGKLWGMNATQWGYWQPGDLKRWDYDRFVAIYNGSSIKPCFTCTDMERAYQILNQQIEKYRERSKGHEMKSNGSSQQAELDSKKD